MESYENILEEFDHKFKCDVKGFKGLCEVVNPYGNSIIVKTQEVSTPKRSTIRAKIPKDLVSLAVSNTEGLTGVLIQHPGTTYFKHGSQQATISCTHSVTRVLPIITLEELKHDRKSTLQNADLAISRIANDTMIQILTFIEEFDSAHISLTNISKDYLKLDDDILRDVILDIRNLRDNLASKIKSNCKLDETLVLKVKLQKREDIIALIHTQMIQFQEYAKSMNEMANKVIEMKSNVNNLYSQLG